MAYKITIIPGGGIKREVVPEEARTSETLAVKYGFDVSFTSFPYSCQYYIDILTAHFVTPPDWFDVIVGSNLLGDILSHLGPAIAGSIDIAPSANLNPERKYPSVFEKVQSKKGEERGQFF